MSGVRTFEIFNLIFDKPFLKAIFIIISAEKY